MNTISRYFIPYIGGPLGERIFTNTQFTVPFHQREVVPCACGWFTCLIKTYLKTVFIASYRPTSILSALNLRVSSVVSPHYFSRSSYLRSLNPGMCLVALLYFLSRALLS